jgi:hypothetical protein
MEDASFLEMPLFASQLPADTLLLDMTKVVTNGVLNVELIAIPRHGKA